jgi:hypothetical protein
MIRLQMGPKSVRDAKPTRSSHLIILPLKLRGYGFVECGLENVDNPSSIAVFVGLGGWVLFDSTESSQGRFHGRRGI